MNPGYPSQIGSIRLMEHLGEGGMAHVYRAEDLSHKNQQLAIKLLRPEVLSDQQIVSRFLREGELMRRLHHPNLAQVYDMGKAAHFHAGKNQFFPYLLMELLAGGSLKLCQGEPPSQIVRRLLPVLEALIYVHESGIIHRDLKPSNLLFSLAGHLKVTDFGVCLWEGSEITRFTNSQMVVGTLGYMAPEQHGDPRKVDARCDVYSMSAILYEYLTGQPYCQVQMPPSAVRPGFPPGIAGLLMQGLAPDPRRRTPSMIRLYDELQAWLDRAEAAGWGEEPLPGFHKEDVASPTLTFARLDETYTSGSRVLPLLDMLQTGDVGSMRAAAAKLKSVVEPGDELLLLEHLFTVKAEAKFAIVQALGEIGGKDAIPSLSALLADNYAKGEAAEALSLIALRADTVSEVLEMLREEGIGSSHRWCPRARLGDKSWVEGLMAAWPLLATPIKIQALKAAQLLPEELRQRVKSATGREVLRGNLKEAWEAL